MDAGEPQGRPPRAGEYPPESTYCPNCGTHDRTDTMGDLVACRICGHTWQLGSQSGLETWLTSLKRRPVFLAPDAVSPTFDGPQLPGPEHGAGSS